MFSKVMQVSKTKVLMQDLLVIRAIYAQMIGRISLAIVTILFQVIVIFRAISNKVRLDYF